MGSLGITLFGKRGLKIISRVLGVLCVLTLNASLPLFSHGASKGLHLHVHPEPAAPGKNLHWIASADIPIKSIQWNCGSLPERVVRRGGDTNPQTLKWSWTLPERVQKDFLECRFEAISAKATDKPRLTTVLIKIDLNHQSATKPTGQLTPVPPKPQ